MKTTTTINEIHTHTHTHTCIHVDWKISPNSLCLFQNQTIHEWKMKAKNQTKKIMERYCKNCTELSADEQFSIGSIVKSKENFLCKISKWKIKNTKIKFKQKKLRCNMYFDDDDDNVAAVVYRWYYWLFCCLSTIEISTRSKEIGAEQS